VVKNQQKANKPAAKELTKEEIELEESFEDDLEIEQIKAQERKNTK
jgi:hypothetical protein